MQFKLNTYFPFPLLKINTLVNFSKVKKPTGISFFLLVLIDEIPDRKTKISDWLLSFGVPADLHDLFAEEMQHLIDMGIIVSAKEYDKTYFSQYVIDSFSFSTKGRKVFREELIPLDRNEELKQIVYFDPVTNKLSLSVEGIINETNVKFDIKQIYGLLTPPSEDMLEEFFNTKKSNGISIKKEEIIVSTKIHEFEQRVINRNLSLTLAENDKIAFDFSDLRLNEYFQSHCHASGIHYYFNNDANFIFQTEPTYQTSISLELDPGNQSNQEEALNHRLSIELSKEFEKINEDGSAYRVGASAAREEYRNKIKNARARLDELVRERKISSDPKKTEQNEKEISRLKEHIAKPDKDETLTRLYTPAEVEKFRQSIKSTIILKQKNEFPISQVHLPIKMKTLMEKKAALDVHSKSYVTANSKNIYENELLLNKQHSGSAFIKIQDLGIGSIYIPAKVSFSNDIFGELSIPLLIEKQISSYSIESIISEIASAYNQFVPEITEPQNYKSLLEICRICKKPSFVTKQIEKWSSKSSIEDMLLLGQIYEQSNNDPVIRDFIKTKGLKLFDKLISETSINNLEGFLSITRWVATSNNLSQIEILKKIFNHITVERKQEQLGLFALLEKNGYAPKDIVVFLKNVPELLFENKSNNSVLGNRISVLLNSLASLKKITGIDISDDYTIGANIDRNVFIETYHVFRDSFKDLEWLNAYTSEYSKIEQFNIVFGRLNELYIQEKSIINNPKAIDRKYIEDKISSGDEVALATCLYVKLTTVFRSRYNLIRDAEQMINKFVKDNVINKADGDILHAYRQFRNDIQHVKPIRRPITKEEYSRITDILFGLEKIK